MPRSGYSVQRKRRSEAGGKLPGSGMDLEFDIPPDQIGEGVLPLLLTLDRQGNDFWFSSSEGKIAPELTLKIVLTDNNTER